MADQFFFAREAEPARGGAAGDDQRLRFRPGIVELYPQVALGGLEIRHRRVGETRAETLGLRLHGHDQFRPVDALREAGKILHQRGRRKLPARLVAFEHERGEIRARGVDGGGEPGAAGADDDDFFHRSGRWSKRAPARAVQWNTGRRCSASPPPFRLRPARALGTIRALVKRIGILTAGGDTPALNATIQGAVVRANQLRVEVIGLIKGFNSLFNPRCPHVHLNPLFHEIPELDPTKGGTLIGSSRDFVDPERIEDLDQITDRLAQLKIEGLICVGGDGTLNGLQPLAERLPTVLAPKTIDNDLGLNYPSEPTEWLRTPRGHEHGHAHDASGHHYKRGDAQEDFSLDHIVNYVTPGYATAVFVSASGVERLRTTAESHRRIAIIEVMGRHSGYIALGTAYGRPDLILVPEQPIDLELLSDKVKQIYDRQKNCVIVCGEGVVDERGVELGAESKTTDPAGNVLLSGAAEALRNRLIHLIGDRYFQLYRRGNSAREAIFTRKVGHTQRGGRPILFDRFHAAQLGAKAVELLAEGHNNAVSILQYNSTAGFHVDGYDANRFRDRWGHIHARRMHPALYDAQRMKPSACGIEYLLPIFTDAIGEDDMEHIRHTLFAAGNLTQPYHSVNTDINKRIRFLKPEAHA